MQQNHFFLKPKIFSFLLLAALAVQKSFCADTSTPFEDLLKAQEEQLQLDDLQRLEEEDVLRAKRSAAENALIDEAVETFYAAAENLEYSALLDDTLALGRIQQIEEIKKSILDLRELDDDTAEVEEILKATLAEAYENLENTSYITTSLEGPLVLRGSSFNARRNAWTLSVTSSLLGYTNLFTQDLRVSYQELTGNLFGPNTNTTKEQQHIIKNDVLIYDSFFRQAIPLLYIRVTYTIQRWKRASEYRFVPQRCELFRSDTNRLIKVFQATELQSELFVQYPQREIRSKEERIAEQEAADAILEKEREDFRAARTANTNKTDSEEKSTQSGRGTLYLTTDTVFTNADIRNFDIKNVDLNSVCINATFGIKKYGFFGVQAGYDYNGGKSSSYGFGIKGGANYRLGDFFRPFAETGLLVHTNKTVVAELGAGLDIIIGKFLLVLSYDAQGIISVTNLLDGNSLTTDDISQAHLFSVGIGLTWK